MADDEGFRRYMQAGMAWFSVTQQKAEGILRDLADSGESAMGQAQKVFDRIVERGRQGSDEVRELVRSEIREQVEALGLATRDDIARLEAKLDAVQAQAQAPPPASPTDEPAAPTRRAARTKTAPITKSAPVTRTAASRPAAVPKEGGGETPAPAAGSATAANAASAGEPAAREARASGSAQPSPDEA